MITQKELQQRFYYENGYLIYKYSVGKKHSGDFAGYKKSDGYWRVYINGKGYYLHRLIWLYFCGDFPNNEIDHIDRNKSNNKIENLRNISHKENQSWMVGYSLYAR